MYTALVCDDEKFQEYELLSLFHLSQQMLELYLAKGIILRGVVPVYGIKAVIRDIP